MIVFVLAIVTKLLNQNQVQLHSSKAHKIQESVSHPAKSEIVKQQAGIITPGLVAMSLASGFRA